MKRLLAASLFLLTPIQPVFADEPLYSLTVEEGSVEVYPNGFWRWADSGGVRCTEITEIASVCALPSNWSPISNYEAPHLKWFGGTNEVIGYFAVNSATGLARSSLEVMFQVMIAGVRAKDGRPLKEVEELEIHGKPAFRFAVSYEKPKGVSLVTGFFVDDISIITETRQKNVGLLHDVHSTQHDEFIAALKIGA